MPEKLHETTGYHAAILTCAIVSAVCAPIGLYFVVRAATASSPPATGVAPVTTHNWTFTAALVCCAVVLVCALIVSVMWLYRYWRGSIAENRTVYDVVSDCSMGDDPAGPWKYGYSQGAGKDFIPFRGRHSDYKDGVDRWFCPERHEDMGVMHNRTDYTVRGSPETYLIPADKLHMHPGRDVSTGDKYCAVVRWQCPEDGTYIIEGSCDGLDKQMGADPVVQIMRGSVELWQTTLVGGVPSSEKFPPLRQHFETGDNLDFVVSQGIIYGADSVGLKATVKKV